MQDVKETVNIILKDRTDTCTPVKQNIELLQEYVTKQLVNVENTINGCLQDSRTYVRDLVDTLSNEITETNEILMQRAREESMNNDLQTMTEPFHSHVSVW